MDAAGLPDDLHALDAAPTHGLNARALILRAAAAVEGEDDDDGFLLPAVGADPARLATAARAGTVKAGRALGAAWPKAEKPFPELIRHAKVERVARIPVLARLAGEYLALALHDRLGAELAGLGALKGDPARAVTVLAMPAERAAAVAAARTQELALYKAAVNGGSYTARAAQTSALGAGEAEAEAAATTAAAPAAPRPKALKRSVAPADPVTAHRDAGPNPRPPPRKRTAVGVDVPVAPPAQEVEGDWTTTDAGLTPLSALRACTAGKDLAVHLQASLASLVDAGKLTSTAASAAVESALSKVLAAHAPAALAGERAGWLDGEGARGRLAKFAVACAKTATEREARAARAAKAAAWGAARAR